AFAQQLLDLRLRALDAFAARLLPAAVVLVVVAGQLVELVEGVDDVGDVEEAVALEAEVDEGGLHAGEDFRDPAFVDVADDTAVPLAFDEYFRDEVVFENGHHRFVAIGGDNHLLRHAQTLRRLRGGSSSWVIGNWVIDRQSTNQLPNYPLTRLTNPARSA